ncbi:aspartate racemase [Caulobacter mirabilis]|uniref:Aspartate racemase n=2 Tax=Caulobacter mirabilis TaxID=69666 RepID=A0A2D2AWE9_9CAUL|nr:amino acid racemase [Caulobacter mirabilis]ATQ42277.1 aspartate racemase [Caulobacter mirabilis]
MGPAATLDFLAKLQAATPAARDQDHLRVLVDINPHVPDRNAADTEPGPVLAEMARNLARAGAQVLAIACNTAHAFADDVRRGSGLPLIDMIDVAVEAAQAAGARRVGVVGTPMARDLYVERLAAAELTPVLLDAEGQARFMETLYRIKGGDLGPAVRTAMTALLRGLSADAVVAGCTEIPLVVAPEALEVPLIDAGETLARRCVAACRG